MDGRPVYIVKTPFQKFLKGCVDGALFPNFLISAPIIERVGRHYSKGGQCYIPQIDRYPVLIDKTSPVINWLVFYTFVRTRSMVSLALLPPRENNLC